ncbi:MAG: DUF4340 domain-containing protein [Planctomycetes bacterium]|nr:DUF4340 domain-containing protein [Planctomycetota bacterium]
MGLRTTLLLLFAALALCAVLWFTDEKPPPQAVAEVAVLDGRSLVECRRMRWQFADQPAIEVSRGADGAFALSDPIADAVSVAHLRQIVAAWDSAQMVATSFQDDAQGRQETGLSRPELVFTAEWPDGTRVQIDVGTPGVAKDDRFLRRDGRIWRGGQAPYESLRVGLDDLRERAVFRAMEPQCSELVVETVQLTGKRERLHLQRAKGGAWRLLAPLQGPADPVRAMQFVAAVLSLRADHFLPGPVRLPEREPDVLVVVRGALGEQTARLWTEQGQLFGQIPGRGVNFNAENRQYGQIFDNAAQNLRATILVPMDEVATQLGEVLLDPGEGRGDRIRLSRVSEAGDWRLLEPFELRAGATPVNELVSALVNLRAIEFADGVAAAEPRTGLGAGRLQLSVRRLEQKQLTTIWLGADEQRGDVPLVHACRADEPGSVVLVPRPAVELLRRPWTVYCRLDLLRLPGAVGRLTVSRRAAPAGTQGAERTFRVADGHWRLEGAEGRCDEVGGFANDVLRDLRGTAAVDLRQPAFGEPDWTLVLAREDGDELARLRFWDGGAGTVLVAQPVLPAAAPSPVGFELEAWVAKSLRELWQ